MKETWICSYTVYLQEKKSKTTFNVQCSLCIIEYEKRISNEVKSSTFEYVQSINSISSKIEGNQEK